MNLPYFLRLLCLCLASFFLVNLAVTWLLAWAAPAAAHWAEQRSPRWGARVLLALRLLPAAAGAWVVLALCVPSYLALEPGAARERVGALCLLAALGGLAAGVDALWRTAMAALATWRLNHQYRRAESQAYWGAPAGPISLIASEKPIVALWGVFRRRIVISRCLLRVLSAEQLQAALRHEQGHGASRDNLKRLLMLLAPPPLPGWRPLAGLERAWARLAEWAADDWAVGADAYRSLSLAEALVRVARMAPPPQAPFWASLLADDANLAARVDRLLHRPSARALPRGQIVALTAGAMTLAGSLLALFLLQPVALYSVHRLLETLIR